MRRSQIAAVIARDMLRADDGKQSNAIECFACGRGMTYRGHRFCGLRCRDWFEAGNPGHAHDWLRPKIDQYGITGWKVIAGSPGIEIGSDYYKPIRDAFERRKASKGRNKVVRLRTGNKIPNYIVRANGHGHSASHLSIVASMVTRLAPKPAP
jgi:hypothetical protein